MISQVYLQSSKLPTGCMLQVPFLAMAHNVPGVEVGNGKDPFKNQPAWCSLHPLLLRASCIAYV